MSLRIGTNVAAMVAAHSLEKSGHQIERAMFQLASGSRLSAPGEDPASFAISEHLRGQVKGMAASRQNAETAISLVQVAEGGLNEQNNLLIRMRELGIQAASDTVSDVEREFIQKEFGELQSEVDRIAKSVRFGSNQLLVGSGKEYTFQVGANKGPENEIKYRIEANTTGDALGIDGLSVRSKSDARDTLSSIDSAITKMGEARSSFGAMQSRMQSVVNHLGDQEVNIEAARSRIADTDVAETVARLNSEEIKAQFQTSILSQANIQPELALKLIG